VAITDYLEKNRAWLGFVLLLASWTAFLLPGWAHTAVVIVSIAIVLAGLSRTLADYKADRAQPGYALIDKIQLGLTLATMLVAVWYRFALGHYSSTAPDIMPLFALINLPRPRRSTPQQEIA
jgi:hypothetical protein